MMSTLTSRASSARVPIKLIIFDAFDTLITPRIAPYLQYAEEARKVGLQVRDEDVKIAFKQSFKQLAKQYPVYGLNTGLPSPDDWWLRLIQQTMIGSGIQDKKVEDAMPILGPALLNRFGSAEAYTLAEGVPDVFEKLNELKGTSINADLKLSLATNSDERILNACKDLGLGRFLDLNVVYDPERAPTNISDEELGSPAKKARIPVSGPTLSYDVGFEKPSEEFFHFAVQRIFPFDKNQSITLSEMCKQTLYVGDHFEEDYLGAKSAGLQAAWLRRKQPELTKEQSDRLPSDEKFNECSSMLDIVNLVKQSLSS